MFLLSNQSFKSSIAWTENRGGLPLILSSHNKVLLPFPDILNNCLVKKVIHFLQRFHIEVPLEILVNYKFRRVPPQDDLNWRKATTTISHPWQDLPAQDL